MRKGILLVLAFVFLLCGCSQKGETKNVEEDTGVVEGVRVEKEAVEEGVVEEDDDIPDISFTTVNLNSDIINSSEFFGKSDITMINLWASWCGPCVGEIPEIMQISNDYADKGVQVCGIALDSASQEEVENLKSFLEDFPITYPIFLANDEIFSLFKVQYVPTTYFVDSKGNLLCEPVAGADVQGYITILDSLLAAEG